MSHKWDKDHADEVSKYDFRQVGIRFYKMEHCGRICGTCMKNSAGENEMVYGYSGPIIGIGPKEVFDSNYRTKSEWDAKMKEFEEKVKAIDLKNQDRIKKGQPPVAFPLPDFPPPQFFIGRCDPRPAPSCEETLGSDWRQFAWYHSHPESMSFSGETGDAGFVLDTGLPLWVTLGDESSSPDKWVTKQLTPTMVATKKPTSKE